MVSAMQAVEAVLSFLAKVGIIYYNSPDALESKVVEESDLVTVKTEEAGIFLPRVGINDSVEPGSLMAEIINPYEGDVIEELHATATGKVFFIHDNPMILSHAVAFRIITQ